MTDAEKIDAIKALIKERAQGMRDRGIGVKAGLKAATGPMRQMAPYVCQIIDLVTDAVTDIEKDIYEIASRN